MEAGAKDKIEAKFRLLCLNVSPATNSRAIVSKNLKKRIKTRTPEQGIAFAIPASFCGRLFLERT
jgi:hypothetical protein